jgi:DNA-binding Xre family transcriptional regulator
MNSTPLIRIYTRNIEHLAFKRGWDSTRLAVELGISSNTFRRLFRSGLSRYICTDLFQTALNIFDCTPNDLLLPQDGIEYIVDRPDHCVTALGDP